MASLTLGTGNSQLVLAAKLEGIYANDFSAEVIVSGNSTPLTVAYASGVFTINVATDGGGSPTSTVSQVIAAISANPVVAQKIIAAQGVGDGSGREFRGHDWLGEVCFARADQNSVAMPTRPT